MNLEKIMTKKEINSLTCMTDLHLHYDGAITSDNARKLANAQNIDIPEDPEELRQLLQVGPDCKDLNEFLEKFEFPLKLMQTKKGIKMGVVNLLTELENIGVMYAELRFAPQLNTEGGLNQDEVVKTAIEGLDGSPVKSGFILCCMRGDDTHEANMETIKVAKKYLGRGVLAVDIAGAEALFPTKNYKREVEAFKDSKLPFTIHAGEADGPSSVHAAIDFGAKRIGHGVRSEEELGLPELIAKKDITLEMCPTSNVNTCIYSDLSQYPLRKFMNAGIKCTINTDDPGVEGTNIKKEWHKMLEHFKLTRGEVRQLLLNSVDAAYCDKDTKAMLRTQIKEEFANLR